MDIYYGYYSKQQFDIIKKKKESPYIYYTDINDNIVQVTEVSKESDIIRSFTDTVKLGKLKKFHSTSKLQISN
jgi:hypothetical protein